MAEVLSLTPARTLERKRVSFTSVLCQTTIFEEDSSLEYTSNLQEEFGHVSGEDLTVQLEYV